MTMSERDIGTRHEQFEYRLEVLRRSILGIDGLIETISDTRKILLMKGYASATAVPGILDALTEAELITLTQSFDQVLSRLRDNRDRLQNKQGDVRHERIEWEKSIT